VSQVDDARQALTESLELRRAEGFLPGVAAGLVTLAEVASEQGRRGEENALLTEARELAERVGAAYFLGRIASAEAALE
jgi:hypothetical protein